MYNVLAVCDDRRTGEFYQSALERISSRTRVDFEYKWSNARAAVQSAIYSLYVLDSSYSRDSRRSPKPLWVMAADLIKSLHGSSDPIVVVSDINAVLEDAKSLGIKNRHKRRELAREDLAGLADYLVGFLPMHR